MDNSLKRFGRDFEELAPVLGMVVDQSRGLTIGDLAFASYEDYWSAGVLGTATTVGAVTTIAPPADGLQLFTSKVGDAQGQGFTSQITYADTNNTTGDRQLVNTVYVAVRCGFRLYTTAAVGATRLYRHFTNPNDLAAVAEASNWSYNIGQTIERRIGTLADWGTDYVISAQSVFGPTAAAESDPGNAELMACQLHGQHRYLPIPLVFQPNVQVDLRARLSRSIITVPAADTALGLFPSTGSVVAVQIFRGVKLILPT